MKLLDKISIVVLVLIFSSIPICYGQNYQGRRDAADKLLEKGEMYGSEGKFREAREAFNKSGELRFYTPLDLGINLEILDYVELQKIKSSLAVNYFKAICAYSSSQGHWKEVISQYNNNVIELNPDDPNVYFIRGHIYEYIYRDYNMSLRLKAYENAMADYTKAIELDPVFFDAYIKRGDLYLVTHDLYDKTISDYIKAIELNSNSAKAYSGLSRIYRFKREYDKAISNISKAIELDPENPSYYSSRANLYLRQKREYDNALSDYSKVINLDPDNFYAYGNRSDIYLLKGLYYKAISDLDKRQEKLREKISGIDRINPFTNYSYRNDEYIDERISVWKKAKNIVLNNDNEYFIRGRTYYDLQQYDYAISDFNKCIELNPKHFLYYEYRGAAYLKENKFEDAIFNYTKAIELSPKDAFNYYIRGKAFKENNQYSNAIVDFNKALELEQEQYSYTEIYLARGDVYNELGQYEKAINDYEKRGFSEKLADLYDKVGRYKEAIDVYTKLLKNNNDSRFYIKRGNVYDRSGDMEKACADWKKACSRGLGNCEGWSIVNRIRCLGK
ncbi:tetratricopeptide repeat protein [Thermodesulfobacteriota bacterium]